MITEIEFKNFKCYKENSIKLSKLTVLTGLNGMGKSTVIQGILGIAPHVGSGRGALDNARKERLF